MTIPRHHHTLTRQLRPLAAAVAAILLGLALIACGSTEATAGQVEVHAALPAAAGPADGHAERADHASQAEPADHAVHASHAEPADHADHARHAEALPAGELPGTSLYHLSSSWTDHHGEAFALPQMRGGPAVFVMFYGDCTTACPLLVKSAEDISAALSDEQRAATRFVMVSFDTARDTPERLAAYAADKGLTGPNWHWLVGSPLQTRQLATLLGVQYRDAGNGMFAHSNVVTVVDSEGVPAARLEGLGIDLAPAVAAIASLTGASR